ncbi:MAG: Lrp/AsnC family transcriptional regulator [Candidatus Heimdallarchaeota archaeon]|nr:Lrp/AsnC family transcriptional regulator [Candidatus Heimdallarchaeota archaeon]
MSYKRINQKDFDIILALIENPASTDVEITEFLNNLPNQDKQYVNTTVHRRIKKLEDEEIVLGATAELNNQVLGLEQHSFLISFPTENKTKNMEVFTQFCNEHPYTSYHNRIYGAWNGMYVVFTIPVVTEAERWLIESLNTLKSNSILEDFTHFPKLSRVNGSKGNLKDWDAEFNRWKVNFSAIFEYLNSSENEPILKDKAEISKVINNLSMFDMILMREFTNNARRSQKEMLADILSSNDYSYERKEIPVTKQSISRRINHLKELNIFESYSLYYSRESFGIFNELLFVGPRDELDIIRLNRIIENGLLPFECNLYELKDKFLFWIVIPPVEALELTELLTSHFDNLQVHFLGRHPARYFFWHRNFDTESKTWKSSEKWMKTVPMDTLGL